MSYHSPIVAAPDRVKAAAHQAPAFRPGMLAAVAATSLGFWAAAAHLAGAF